MNLWHFHTLGGDAADWEAIEQHLEADHPGHPLESANHHHSGSDVPLAISAYADDARRRAQKEADA